MKRALTSLARTHTRLVFPRQLVFAKPHQASQSNSLTLSFTLSISHWVHNSRVCFATRTPQCLITSREGENMRAEGRRFMPKTSRHRPFLSPAKLPPTSPVAPHLQFMSLPPPIASPPLQLNLNHPVHLSID
ncbi:hypothetical protein E2C01_084418 [Portunus trituberculatus]|uniref:Uncharacterized protein n=1 Tax=Portunus trituberculatus TaxID=210409 RepID=A0A5B7J7F5_PORTR|nr:hypothetical protein [Portunus trituberculatus]